MNDPTPVGRAAIDMPAATFIDHEGEVVEADVKCSISADDTHGGHVMLTIRVGLGLSRTEVKVRVSPDEAAYLGSHLVESARHAYNHRLRALVKGSCETCGNLRLIQDPTKDRPWQINCPTCTQDEATPIPTIASWPDAEVSP